MQALRLLAIDGVRCPNRAIPRRDDRRRRSSSRRPNTWRARCRAAAHVINLSENRYHFLLGWVAACLREQVTLLPPGQTDDVLARLRREYPDHHTLDDESVGRLLAQAAAPAATRFLRIGSCRPRASSRSHSLPDRRAHRRRIRKPGAVCFHNSRLAAAEVLGGTNRSLVSTVPPQHMYGLEVSLLSALTAESFLCDGKPFYPGRRAPRAREHAGSARAGDDARASEDTRGCRGRTTRHSTRVVSATAPMPVELARRIEAAWRTELVEIYGCTEAGVMAHRRPSQSESWRTFSGGTMTASSGAAEYFAPQLGGSGAAAGCARAAQRHGVPCFAAAPPT